MPVQRAQGRLVWQRHVIGQFSQRPWLQSPGSLTQLLKSRYADFVVHTQNEGWCKPLQDDWPMLQVGRHTSHYWVRDVWLMGGGRPRVFAHSVIPRQALRSAWRQMRSMGVRPLGAALFANPRIQRGALSFCKLPRQHVLMRTIQQTLNMQHYPVIWARRSMFAQGRNQLLVTEVFLPEDLHDTAC